MKRKISILFILALGLIPATQALALGLGGGLITESVHVGAKRPGGTADLAYDQLDVKLNGFKFTLLDLGRPMGTGLYSSSKSGEESFWNRRAAIGEPEHGTQWLHGSSSLSYLMGSSTGADEIMKPGDAAASPAPASTNSFWGVDLDLGLGQYQFLKLPLELSFAYDVQFRSYTFTGLYDGTAGKAGTDMNGMTVNGFFSAGADLGIIPGLVASARVGYDPFMAVIGSLYPDLISPGYRIDGGAEWMPLKFLTVFATYEQVTTGFFGVPRTVTISDISLGGRFYFY